MCVQRNTSLARSAGQLGRRAGDSPCGALLPEQEVHRMQGVCQDQNKEEIDKPGGPSSQIRSLQAGAMRHTSYGRMQPAKHWYLMLQGVTKYW